MSRNRCLLLLVLAGLACPALAQGEGDAPQAAEARVIHDRWGFYVGGFLTDFQTDAAVGSGNLLGTFIRAEDELGLKDDDSTFRAEGFVRFKPRHGLDIGIWDLNREGLAVIEKDIQWQEELFELGAEIASAWDTSWFRVAYRYSMLHTRRGEAGITAGLSLYDFDLFLEGEASLGGGSTQFVRSEEQILAPVPTLGFFINYAMRPQLLLRLKADFFNLHMDDYEGRLVDTSVGVEWYFSRHAGIGVMANGTSIEVKNRGEDPYNIQYRQSGLVGFFTFVFGQSGS